MKIIVDARELRTSTGRYIERLLHYLQQVDTENNYTVLLKPKDMEGWQPTNRKFKAVACRYKEFSFGEQLGMRRQLRKLQPDLVHFGMTQQPILYFGKAVTTVHDLTTARFRNPSKNRIVFAFKQFFYKVVIRVAAHKSAALITPTEYVREDLARFASINSRKVTVTYESADKIEVPAQPLTVLEDKKFIMYIGRPMPHKNLDRLVEAFALIQAKHPELYLVLAGKLDANYRSLRRAVKRKSLKGVVFTSFVEEGELRWLYENAACYVFPSLSEGFGLPGLEAMVHGCPVASSNASCLPEVYGDAAHYFDPENVSDMAAKISEVVTKEALRKELVAKGRSQAKKYSWDRMAEQTLEVYKEVLGSKS